MQSLPVLQAISAANFRKTARGHLDQSSLSPDFFLNLHQF
jgi:hypothetical protein